jgi:hypothetical protein
MDAGYYAARVSVGKKQIAGIEDTPHTAVAVGSGFLRREIR